ncbi:hypothetical protein CVCC1112_2614 [Paenarthrobacter nicotinovorans]|nr:hypothetical protein CVCC1112_2614 [Paenarthrobacter nicotinovorans]
MHLFHNLRVDGYDFGSVALPVDALPPVCEVFAAYLGYLVNPHAMGGC